MKNLNDKINDTLIKKALGYRIEESVCEYGIEEDNIKLIKKKVSTKYFPPDLSALNILLNNNKSNSLETMSDAELEKIKAELIELIKKEEQKNGTKGNK